jgi:hypothetical protein
MARPNRIATSKTGRKLMIGAVEAMPRICWPLPSWNTNVVAPNAAPIVSKNPTTAVIGTNSDRKTSDWINSARPTTRMRNTGSAADSLLDVSMFDRGRTRDEDGDVVTALRLLGRCPDQRDEVAGRRGRWAALRAPGRRSAASLRRSIPGASGGADTSAAIPWSRSSGSS